MLWERRSAKVMTTLGCVSAEARVFTDTAGTKVHPADLDKVTDYLARKISLNVLREGKNLSTAELRKLIKFYGISTGILAEQLNIPAYLFKKEYMLQEKEIPNETAKDLVLGLLTIRKGYKKIG